VGDTQPADGLDRLRPGGAVGAHAAQHDADGPLALLRGQAAEEVVDGPVGGAPRAERRPEVQPAVSDRQDAARPDDVDVIRRDGHAVLDLGRRHGGVPGEDLGHLTFAVRRQVLDEDEGHPGVGPHGSKERLLSFSPHPLYSGGEGFQVWGFYAIKRVPVNAEAVLAKAPAPTGQVATGHV
jgi:hypothetical protein